MEIVPIDQINLMANAISKSNFFGLKTAEQAAALMLVAQADGLHPAKAATHYHIIQGRPALSADAMLARFQSVGGKVKWESYDDQAVVGTFTHSAGGSVTIRWDLARAKKAGIGNLDKYPAAMMRARCISEGVRTVYPGVIVGMYTPEEVSQFAAPEVQVIEVQPEPEADPFAEIFATDNLGDLTAVFKRVTKGLEKSSERYVQLVEAAGEQKLSFTQSND
jgi:hypothetical protein